MNKLNQLYLRMVEFDQGYPDLIEHFMKVALYTYEIGTKEGCDTVERLVAAALLHDIGIKVAYEKDGYQTHALQEYYGPLYAKPLLEHLDYEPSDIDRICFMIGHHHSYNYVDNLEFQILFEADALVNMIEDHYTEEQKQGLYDHLLKTETSRFIYHQLSKEH